MNEYEAIEAARYMYVVPRTGEWDRSEEGDIVRALVEALEKRIEADA